MSLDPRRARILLAVARAGGVVAAADELGQTASAVSQQIAKLEAEVGQPLLTRTPRGSVLTPAGEAVADAAEAIECALAVADSRLATVKAGFEGTVVIGGFASFLRAVVIPKLSTWREEYPQLAIHIVEDDADALVRLMRRGKIDALVCELDAVGVDKLPAAGLVEVPLLDEPWKLAVPAGVRGSLDLSAVGQVSLPWLGIPNNSAASHVLRRLQSRPGAHHEERHRYDETLTGLGLVAAGEGVAVVPHLALQGMALDGVEIVDLPGLGTRRIVLRHYDYDTKDAPALSTAVQLISRAAADLGQADGR